METIRFSTNRELLERQCVVTFMKASGPGGQHRNKRETGVRLFHPPSGITVTAVERRSQAQNREEAFKRLAARLEIKNKVRKKRISTRPSKAAINKRLHEKTLQAMKKKMRSNNADED